MKRLVTILAVSVLAALASVTLAGKGGGGKPGGDPPPADPAIAYREAGKFGASYLCVANADGSNATRIVEANAIHDADWSPAGNQLCFFGAAPDPGLYIVNVDGTGLTLAMGQPGFTVNDPKNPSWCPVAASDGEYKIVFSKKVQNPDGSWADHELFLVNPDGSGLLRLTNTPTIGERNASWSPDGRRLAVGDDHQTTHEVLVYYLDEAGTAIIGSEHLTDAGPLGDREVYRPRWARTKDELVVWVHEPGLMWGHLWIIPVADPYSPRQITSSPDYTEMGAHWSEDDSQLLYWAKKVKGRSQYGGYLMASDGSDAPGEFLLPQRQPLAWRR